MKISYPKIFLFIPLPILLDLYVRYVPINERFILTTITSVLSCILIFKIVSLSTKNKLYSILSLLIFIVWGIPHLNFTSPIIFSLTFVLLVCFSLLYFGKNSKQRYLFFAGIAAFIAVVFYKYLFFLILVPPLVFFAFIQKNKILNFLTFIYGYIWGFILFATYLLISNLFPTFVNSLLLFRGFKFYFWTSNLQTLALFSLPLILVLLSTFILLKRRKLYMLFLPFFAAIFSFSIIPNFVNPNYLNVAISLSGISLSILMRYSANSTIRTICIIFSVFLILNGIITYGYN